MTRIDYENSVFTVALILMLSYSPLKYRLIKNFYASSNTISRNHKAYYISIHLSHCCHIFFVVVCLRWLYYHSLSSITYISREHWDFVSIICVQSIDVQSMVFANDRIPYGLQVVFFCLQITPSHYHHYADSSECIELIKCLSCICCRVCV